MEAGADLGREFLQAMQEAAQAVLQGGTGARDRSLGQAALDILVEEFVGIVLGRVGRQEDQLDPVLVRCHPGLNRLGVVDLQVVEDQEDLALLAADQALEEGEAELEAVTTRAAVNAAAKKLQRARPELRALEDMPANGPKRPSDRPAPRLS